jgi:hypothetical protein
MPAPAAKNFDFDKGLKSWIQATSNSKDLARALSEVALKHFKDHGQVAKLQELHDTFTKHGKNYVRIAAFLKWLQAHAPITMLGGKFLKDKKKDWDETKYLQAFDTPFWDFAPDPENVVWAYSDVVKTLTSALKKFEKDNYSPVNEEALQKFEKAKALVASLA